MYYDKLLSIFQKKQLEVAQSALQRPITTNIEYEYGKMVGLYAGLEIAIKVLLEFLKDEEFDNG